jgi:hypothetical protein
MANSSDHHEFFSVLEELYTLLDQLAAVPPSIGGVAIFPPPETGIHAASDFDPKAAKAAGFSDEAVKVLSSMPYLDYPLELQPNAIAVTYYGMDQSDFEDVRELVPGGADAELAPPSIIKLTDSLASLGVQYMYDAETSMFARSYGEMNGGLKILLLMRGLGLMFPWTPIMDGPVDDDDERDMTGNYFHAYIPSTSPREALQPLIDKYRGLQYIIKPPRGGFGHELYLEEYHYLRPYEGPEERREESEASDREILSTLRGLKDLYLRCGWNINTAEAACLPTG